MSIGETLAAARLAAGLTTAQVAETTRIRRTLIEAIEADDYRLCGGDVYARGHIAHDRPHRRARPARPCWPSSTGHLRDRTAAAH